MHRFGIGKYAAATGRTAKQQKAVMWYDGMPRDVVTSADVGQDVSARMCIYITKALGIQHTYIECERSESHGRSEPRPR